MGLKITVRGTLKETEAFLERARSESIFSDLHKYGELGVEALADATPVDSDLTAKSWTYSIEKRRGRHTIVWRNTNVVDGVPVAVLIQYGHATGSGAYVQGRDYINPAIRPIFDELATKVWKVVTK